MSSVRQTSLFANFKQRPDRLLTKFGGYQPSSQCHRRSAAGNSLIQEALGLLFPTGNRSDNHRATVVVADF
jgi:hypothetical protein